MMGACPFLSTFVGSDASHLAVLYESRHCSSLKGDRFLAVGRLEVRYIGAYAIFRLSRGLYSGMKVS